MIYARPLSKICFLLLIGVTFILMSPQEAVSQNLNFTPSEQVSIDYLFEKTKTNNQTVKLNRQPYLQLRGLGFGALGVGAGSIIAGSLLVYSSNQPCEYFCQDQELKIFGGIMIGHGIGALLTGALLLESSSRKKKSATTFSIGSSEQVVRLGHTF